MKSNYLIIAGLVLTNIATLVYFRGDGARRVEVVKDDRPNREQLQAEIAALTEKLAESERAMAELKKTGIRLGKLDPAKTAEMRRRQNSPAQIAARMADQRQIVQRQYAAFIKKQALSEASAETLQQLIVELRQAPRDEFERRRAAGLPDVSGEESRKIVQGAQQPVYDSIRTLLGDGGYAAFEHYNRTLTERHQLEQMTLNLRLSDHPLSDAQFDTVIEALSVLNREVMTANGGFMPINEAVEALDRRYATVLEKSAAVLSPAQLAGIKRAFDEDIALRRMRAAAAAERVR